MTPRKLILPPIVGCVCGNSDCIISFGLCHCGCGRETKIAKFNDKSKNQRSGQPKKFIVGHYKRLRGSGDPTPFMIDGVECCSIFLSKNKRTTVNSSLYDTFSYYNYSALETRYPGKFYAVRRCNGKFIFLHREVLNMSDGDNRFVDHRNGDTLDNRIENLRIASPSQNGMNAKLSKSNTTGFKGVSFNTQRRKWIAQIRFNGKNHFLGYFTNPQEAHQSYCNAAIRLAGEFANFG